MRKKPPIQFECKFCGATAAFVPDPDWFCCEQQRLTPTMTAGERIVRKRMGKINPTLKMLARDIDAALEAIREGR